MLHTVKWHHQESTVQACPVRYTELSCTVLQYASYRGSHPENWACFPSRSRTHIQVLYTVPQYVQYSTILTIINQITPYCTSFFRFEISPFDCFEAISSAAWLSSVRFSHPYITATNPSISKSMIEREKLKSPPSHQCEDLKWIEYCMYCTGSVDRKATCELHLRYQSVGLGWICSINSTTLLGPS